MPSSPHATDGTTYKIRLRRKTEATKELLFARIFWGGGGQSIRVTGIRRWHRTRPVYERKKKKYRTEEIKVATEIQTEMYIYTPVIYKNKVSLGGASSLVCGAGAAASPACRVCKGRRMTGCNEDSTPASDTTASGFQLPRVCLGVVHHFCYSINSFVRTKIELLTNVLRCAVIRNGHV